MKIAVCVKYVPVISRIQFDYEQKTIIREGVPSEVNPFDLLGVVRAVEMKQGAGDEVVVISMGPPSTRDGLMQCLALGADRAVLVSDRALAGSDTLATARALALALARENPDLVICGRNSADSETGQVGPEIAELMDIPVISQVRKLEYTGTSGETPGGVIAERIHDEGYQVIEASLPALVCVTEGVAPELYPNREGMAAAQEKPLEELTAADLSSDFTQFGVEGSPTWVQDIRLVEPDRLGVIIEEEDPFAAARQVSDALKERLAVAQSGAAGAGSAGTLARYPGVQDKSIWVVCETAPGGLSQVTLEMLGKARELTSFTKSEVAVVLIGAAQEETINTLAAYGADRVLVLDNAGLGAAWGRSVGKALASAVEETPPYAMLFASTPDGRDLASGVAARLGLGLTGDAIDLEVDQEGRLVQLKPALGGNVVAPILSKTLPNLVTMRPGLLTPSGPDSTAAVTVEHIAAADAQVRDIKVLEDHREEDTSALALIQAQVVLGVGMGIGGPENLAVLRGMAAEIGATLATTRDVVHAGWLPHQIQVGISGRAIAPSVYLAVGIRGAFNHTVGIQKAGVIIAVNPNRRHAIFRSTDYGIVGDWETYLPPLIEALKPVLTNIA